MADIATQPAQSRWNFWIMAGLVALVAASLAGLAAATGWEEVWASLSRLGWAQVAFLLVLSLFNYAMRALRWLIYCRITDIPVSWIQAARHYFAGFAMTVTPGRLGELVRLRWIKQETGVPYSRSAPILLMDRAADLAAMALLMAAAFLFSAGGGGPRMIAVAAITLCVAFVATRASVARAGITLLWRMIGKKPRLFGKLRNMARLLGPFSRAQVMLPALALGFAGWFAEGLALWYLLTWLGADIGLWAAVGIFAVSMVLGGALPTPGGLGGAEAAMVVFLQLQGVPLEISVPATVVIRLTTLWFAIAIGVGVFPAATYFANKRQRARET